MRYDSRFADTLTAAGKDYAIFPVLDIEGASKLPLSLKVLLENILRNAKSDDAAQELAARVIEAGTQGKTGEEVEFCPARVLFQDFTGVPVFVDFAVMREACQQLGGDPAKINPQVPCDLVIDHSVIADEFGCESALDRNQELEFQRNKERYDFLKWSQKSFKNVRIVPPGVGICHQLNIEKFAHVVMTSDHAEATLEGCNPVAYFDTLVGTDSHTPTANGIGVLGWGVGGIEAEAAALGQPITTLVPRVIGVNLKGSLPVGVTGMDVALTFAQILRAKGVVGCFVECFGEGVSSLSATQRACVSNMTPEYGSTCTLFPVDEKTLDYLRMTGRDEAEIALVEAYAKKQGFWNDPASNDRVYSEVIELDLSTIERSIAGPSRPHDRLTLSGAKQAFNEICEKRACAKGATASASIMGVDYELTHGALAIAAVTSCTTATDPAMMLSAGLVAKKAAEAGLSPKPWVKTILAPGSHATAMLLERAGLMDGLRKLGFNTCGFGCMSCIGNSGPVLPAMHDICDQIELASVLSGNRNFEGRISPDVSQNYLAAPGVVIAYSLAGTMDFDLEKDALGVDAQGNSIYLADIWPTEEEIANLVATYVNEDLFSTAMEGMFDGDASWQAIEVSASDVFTWDEGSTYVRRAPYFDGMELAPSAVKPIEDAFALAKLGDFITTDHISPAGAIAPAMPAALYLEQHGVAPADFNTYGSRRGNHEVMMRGTFANVKLQNQLADGKKGGWSRDLNTDEVKPLFDVSQSYVEDDISMIVVAGKMYGSGSSRDWAAKGPQLLGVRAVIAESFERIHRSNLIGMGILPLQFIDGQNAEALGLDGTERYSVQAVDFSKGLPEPAAVTVSAKKPDGDIVEFSALVRVDTPTEGEYYAHGGILQFVLRNLI